MLLSSHPAPSPQNRKVLLREPVSLPTTGIQNVSPGKKPSTHRGIGNDDRRNLQIHGLFCSVTDGNFSFSSMISHDSRRSGMGTECDAPASARTATNRTHILHKTVAFIVITH